MELTTAQNRERLGFRRLASDQRCTASATASLRKLTALECLRQATPHRGFSLIQADTTATNPLKGYV
jgi:hypothetical protein